MTPSDWRDRYSRQIRLAQLGEDGQRRLRDAHALIVGLGGLGAPAAMYLTAAGIGKLTLADFDRVEPSNLQRQIIHRHADLGELKAHSAAATLRALTPELQIETLDYSLDADDLIDAADGVDIILDCTDNFATRFAINRASQQTKTPLIVGAAIRFEGQITAFDPNNPSSPCYRCLYPEENITADTCENEGVIAPLVGVIGAMQAMEAINLLRGDAQLVGRVWLFDAQTMEWQQMRLPKNPQCAACASG